MSNKKRGVAVRLGSLPKEKLKPLRVAVAAIDALPDARRWKARLIIGDKARLFPDDRAPPVESVLGAREYFDGGIATHEGHAQLPGAQSQVAVALEVGSKDARDIAAARFHYRKMFARVVGLSYEGLALDYDHEGNFLDRSRKSY